MTAGSPRAPAAAATPAFSAAALVQSQFLDHKPNSMDTVDRRCLQLWAEHKRDQLCRNCLPFLMENEAKATRASSTDLSASPTVSATSVAVPSSSAPVLAVGPVNPMLMSSQLDRSSLPPFVTVQTSRIFISRMMHLWVATGTTWCLESAWNWAVEYLEGEDWLKLTPTHTTLWVAIAATVYLLSTHFSEWYFPNPSPDNPPTRTYLKTLKFLTCVHVAAALTSYFKVWIHPFKGIACMVATFAFPYNKIEGWGVPKRENSSQKR